MTVRTCEGLQILHNSVDASVQRTATIVLSALSV